MRQSKAHNKAKPTKKVQKKATKPLAKVENLASYLLKSYANHPHAKALSIKKNGHWESWSNQEFIEKTTYLAAFINKRLRLRKKLVGLMGPYDPTWALFDLSLIGAGNISVPFFMNASQTILEYQIKHCGLTTIFVGNLAALEIITPFIKKFKTILLAAVSEKNLQHYCRKHKIKNKNQFFLLKDALALGKKQPLTLEQFPSMKKSDLATIIYTSGSMGKPKGVMLSHSNLLHQIKMCQNFFELDPQRDYLVSFLPLSHIYERVILYFCLFTGLPIYFTHELSQLGNLIKEVRPTVMTLVPRLLEKVYYKMEAKLQSATGFKKWLGNLAFQHAKTAPLGRQLGLKDRLLDRLVYRKLREALGGQLRMVMSGGVSLSNELLNFFINVGIPIYEGYGLTEHSPTVSANAPGQRKPQTVGKILPGIKAKVNAQGELLLKSGSVMEGYYKQPKLTKETLLAGGWLKTGDLAKIDSEGFLTITGRKKEQVKTSTGRYIPINELEKYLNRHPAIEQSLVVAENRPFVVALLFIAEEFKPTPLKLKRQLDDFVTECNKKLNDWEQIKYYQLSEKTLSIESGELTPKLSLQRQNCLAKHKTTIEALYKRKPR